MELKKNLNLLLASKSPRRREMLTWLKLPFQVTHADVDETPRVNEASKDLAVRLSMTKAQHVDTHTFDIWILAADTIVECGDQALGKPANVDQADDMLRKLREGKHRVHTGLSLFHPKSKQLMTYRVSTEVWMRPYSDDEIDVYIASGDPMDKAGAYAIQHTGFHPVQKVNRCYANVVGLPLCSVASVLIKAGYVVTDDIPRLCLTHFGYDCPERDEGTQI